MLNLKRKINTLHAAAESRRASFTPFVVSVDGVFGRKATCFLRELLSVCPLSGTNLTPL